jgi:hypothetical protein
MQFIRGLAVAIALAVAAVPAPGWADETAPEAAPSPQRMVGFVAGGLGVAGLAGGVVFGLLASASWNSSKNECPTATVCPDHARALADHDSAERSVTTSTATFVAGAALLAGALVLVVTAPPERPRAALRITPAVAPDQAGLAISGTF